MFGSAPASSKATTLAQFGQLAAHCNGRLPPHARTTEPEESRLQRRHTESVCSAGQPLLKGGQLVIQDIEVCGLGVMED